MNVGGTVRGGTVAVGVPQPPFEQPVGDGRGVGVSQKMPGPQVGVAALVKVGGTVRGGAVPEGVPQKPFEHLVGDGFCVGRGVGVRPITFVGVPQILPGAQGVGSGLPVGVALRSPVACGVGVPFDVLVGVPQITPGSQGVGSTVKKGKGAGS